MISYPFDMVVYLLHNDLELAPTVQTTVYSRREARDDEWLAMNN